jgi:type VI secretion system protein
VRRWRKGERRLRTLPALLFIAMVSACSMPTLFKPKIALRELAFEVAPSANDNMPFAVELVATADDEVLKKLLTLSAAQWFDPQTNIKRDFPKDVRSWYFELTPGQRMAINPTPFGNTPGKGLVLFAHYKGQGAYRLRLDSFNKAKVIFAATAIRIDAPP